MKKFLSNLFIKEKISSKYKSFEVLREKTKVAEIFKAITTFNSDSEIRYVGGCVRKILNNEKFDDIDFATNLKPPEIKEALQKKNIKFFETGITHGTITARIENINYEITSLRKDVKTDGRHAIIEFSKDWKEDSSRRDFSINSIYSDIEGNLFDPNDGVKDLKEGKINFIGNAETRIKEDYLRILRYLRFFVNYSKKDHNQIIQRIIKQNISGIANLSKERLLDELRKLILSPGFFNIPKNKFSRELFLLIFPQLSNIDIFKKLNKFSLKILSKKNFEFFLSLLVIDETDNSEYFLYKYNVSNEIKKKIIFLKKIFDQGFDQKTFLKNNLEKIFYYYDKDNLIDLIDFYLIKFNKKSKKIIELKNYFEKKEKPQFPINTKELMEKYNLKEGRDLGQKLKNLEEIWIKNSFKISKSEIDKVFSN